MFTSSRNYRLNSCYSNEGTSDADNLARSTAKWFIALGAGIALSLGLALHLDVASSSRALGRNL